MSIKVEDGKGRGNIAGVNNVNRLDVSARVADRDYYTSRDAAQTYNWSSFYSASSADEIIYLKNNSKTNELYITDFEMYSSAGSAIFDIYEVSGTASGTTITGKNLNLTSSNLADSTALGNAAVTGITIGDRIHTESAVADETVLVPFGGALILGFGDAIAVTFTGTGGNVGINIRGHFEFEE